jgi:hypothetical protein
MELMKEALYWGWDFPPNATLEKIYEYIAVFDEKAFQIWVKNWFIPSASTVQKFAQHLRSIKINADYLYINKSMYMNADYLNSININAKYLKSINIDERNLFSFYIENEVAKKNLPQLTLDAHFFGNLPWGDRITDFIGNNYPSYITDILYQIKRRINIRFLYLQKYIEREREQAREKKKEEDRKKKEAWMEEAKLISVKMAERRKKEEIRNNSFAVKLYRFFYDRLFFGW